MSIDQPNTIDFLVHDKDKHQTVLIISDHLDWRKNEHKHLQALQDKLNYYIWFIENGKIVETMPDLEGLPVVITVWGKHPLSAGAKKYYDLAKQRAIELGFSLEFDLNGESLANN